MRKLKKSGGPNIFLGYLIPFVIIGLTIADFVPDQKIDKILLGMLLIFGLGALGWRLDEIVGESANTGKDDNVADSTNEPG